MPDVWWCPSCPVCGRSGRARRVSHARYEVEHGTRTVPGDPAVVVRCELPGPPPRQVGLREVDDGGDQ